MDRRIQTELLEKLRSAPQEGMEELVERFSGLIWTVISRYLDNPEDIRECVNDTFAEFYCHRDRYDPDRGSLEIFLAAIAKNLAIDRLRKAQPDTVSLPEDLPGDADYIEHAEIRADLEQAIAALSPEDAEIIRMKYYNGMTVAEIAASLHLPYETVKKRHQRSLKKMRKALIIGLILLLGMLLAACIYRVLRHYHIIPGFGVVSDADSTVYMLAQEASAEDLNGRYTITDAIYSNGTLALFLRLDLHEGADGEALIMRINDVYAEYGLSDSVEQVPPELIGDDGSTDPSVLSVYTDDAIYYSLPKRSFGYVITNQMRMLLTLQNLTFPKDGALTLSLFGQDIPFVLEPRTPQSADSFPYALGKHGGLSALPRQQDGHMLIDIFSLNLGEYDISPNLITNSYRQGKLGDILLIASDGTEYPGVQLPSKLLDSYAESFSTWDFGQLKPGEYTLQIPYLYLTQTTDWRETIIPINLKTCSLEDVSYPVLGGSIRITAFQFIPDGELLPAYVVNRDSGWLFRFEYDPTDPDAPTLMDIPLHLSLHDYHASGNTHHAPGSPENRYYEFFFTVQSDETADLSEAELQIGGAYNYYWNCSFEIPITVEP